MPENMASTDDSPETEELAAPAPTPPKRGPGHRGQDVRDTMAEMAAKAHEISLEAGSRMTATMREVIGAAAGLTAFAIESARDLVQYMVRRGQMSQDEADKLMREVEAAHGALPKPAPKPEAAKDEATRKAPAIEAAINHFAHPVVPKVRPPTVEPPKPAAPTKAAPAAKAPAAGKPAPAAKPTAAAKPPATKPAAKGATKSAPAAKTVAKVATPPKAAPAKATPAKAAPAKSPPKKR